MLREHVALTIVYALRQAQVTRGIFHGIPLESVTHVEYRCPLFYDFNNRSQAKGPGQIIAFTVIWFIFFFSLFRRTVVRESSGHICAVCRKHVVLRRFLPQSFYP